MKENNEKSIKKRYKINVIKYYVETITEGVLCASLVPFMYLMLNFNKYAAFFCVAYSTIFLIRGIVDLKEKESRLDVILGSVMLVGGILSLFFAILIYLSF